MRDGLEDYEYLYRYNGALPVPGSSNTSDALADKMVSGLTSYTRDDNFCYNLRRLIGLKLGNEIAAVPDIQPQSGHPRTAGPPGNYFINFQDPAGQPIADPLIVNGKTYTEKIGWNPYDSSLGYGWYGDMAHVMYQYITTGPNPLQNSIIFDDWGRQKTFEFDLPNGRYNVTVSVGWANKTYSHHKIEIEGTAFINDEGTSSSTPYLVRTKSIQISDHKLTMNMGIFNEYTMLNYLDIEADTSGVLVEGGTGNKYSNHYLTIRPVPVNSMAILNYYIGSPGNVDIVFFNMAGQKIHSLSPGKTAGGGNRAVLATRGWPKGFYFCVLRVDGIKYKTIKFLVL
jgi:hypothetical protein